MGPVGLGSGPDDQRRVVNLFCAWLAWCRQRVVIPTWDRRLPTVIACLDRSMRIWGGGPTYWLTDNERTVTIDHVAGIAVRHTVIVAAGLHYGVTIATCVPADPESKGGGAGERCALRSSGAGLVNRWPLHVGALPSDSGSRLVPCSPVGCEDDRASLERLRRSANPGEHPIAA